MDVDVEIVPSPRMAAGSPPSKRRRLAPPSPGSPAQSVIPGGTPPSPLPFGSPPAGRFLGTAAAAPSPSPFLSPAAAAAASAARRAAPTPPAGAPPLGAVATPARSLLGTRLSDVEEEEDGSVARRLALSPERPAAAAPEPLSAAAEADADGAAAVVQMDRWYVARGGPLGDEERVVKLVEPGKTENSVRVQLYAPHWTRNKRITFRRSLDGGVVEVPVSTIRHPGFVLHAGQAPKHVVDLFSSKSTRKVVESISSVATDLTSCSISSAGDGAGSQGDDECRLTKVTALRSQNVVSGPRFRYVRALNKMKELGYPDTPQLRDLITMCGGDERVVIRDYDLST
eukprot:TRINITY_DN14079_c0_g1_i4.p1 TRINITY_DN14079_c0_g1~~TRINITY_DN14079_c0_g1_i4.p1  ORF type:complete len:372 (-),score=99.38 TRINITY_DN14079_c0_g1_i4:38-1063(-)